MRKISYIRFIKFERTCTDNRNGSKSLFYLHSFYVFQFFHRFIDSYCMCYVFVRWIEFNRNSHELFVSNDLLEKMKRNPVVQFQSQTSRRFVKVGFDRLNDCSKALPVLKLESVDSL